MTSFAKLKTLCTVGLAVAALFGSSSTAFASTACTETLIAVQTEYDGAVLVKFKNGTWHVAAAAGTTARDRLSVALAAHLSGRTVTLQWTGSHSCSTSNTSTPAISISVNN